MNPRREPDPSFLIAMWGALWGAVLGNWLLAPKVIGSIYETLGEIAKEGTTVVLVEQDVTQALSAADRAYCLLEGRVSLQGPTSEITREQVIEAYFGVKKS